MERLLKKPSSPYGIPDPSRTLGSQEEPIVLSSDDEVKIKKEITETEKPTEPENPTEPEKPTEPEENTTESEKAISKHIKRRKRGKHIKKTVSKTFIFFIFFYLVSHKNFFLKKKILFFLAAQQKSQRESTN